MDADIHALVDMLVKEILVALGLPDDERWHRLCKRLFGAPLYHLSQIGLTFDRTVREKGFSKAASWALKHWCRRILARRDPALPQDGPLLIVSNHPGTYDSLVLASTLQRDDARFIASAIPFLRSLPSSREHFFFISKAGLDRALAIRHAIRHLQAGKTLLLFGSGQIDPDPAVYRKAEEGIHRWSQSINLLLQAVPETRLAISIISHVVAPEWRYSPLYWLRKRPVDRRRIVEFAQVIAQLCFPGRWMLSPRITLTAPKTLAELQDDGRSREPWPAIVQWGCATLNDHLTWARALR